MIRRAGLLVLQVAVAFQAVVAAVVAPAAIPGPGPTIPSIRAAGPCEIVAGDLGGLLTACPDATSFDAVANGVADALDAERARRATSRLEVASEPAGATVHANGIALGTTPLEASLPAGTYRIRLALEGYVPATAMTTVDAGRPATVAVTLMPAVAEASLTTVEPGPLLALLGQRADAPFAISAIVRDRDGAWYVAYGTAVGLQLELDRPLEYNGDPIDERRIRSTLSVVGVARSPDGGRTWQLVGSWRETFEARGWTSDRYADREWTGPGEHWARIYWMATRSEDWRIRGLAPRDDGGISVFLGRRVSVLHQRVVRVYDNLASPRIDECDEPRAPGDPGVTCTGLGSPGYAARRWGMSEADLAERRSAESEELVLDSRGGDPVPRVIGGPAAMSVPVYQGSHDGTAYFLGFETWEGRRPERATGYVLTSRDGGRTLQPHLEYQLAPALEADRRPDYEELRIAPDGSLRLVAGLARTVYALDAGGLRPLGTLPEVAFLGSRVPAAFDSDGNLHGLFLTLPADQQGRIQQRWDVNYQLFPRAPVRYDRAVLLTVPDCPACDAARAFLADAGAAADENAAIPPALEATVATVAASAGYPVLVRVGPEPAVVGAAEAASISRTLGLSHPVRVGSVERGYAVSGRTVSAYYEPWALILVEDDVPRIVAEGTGGIVTLSPAPGAWRVTPLVASPRVASSVPGMTWYRHFPRYPGVGALPRQFTGQRDVPFNRFDRVADLAMLYHLDTRVVPHPVHASESGTQEIYAIATLQPAAAASATRVVAQASQLIPVAVLEVALGPTGVPSAVRGELAPWVVSQGVVTADGDRLYRVVVDLRARNETAVDGRIVSRTIGGAITVATEDADGAPESREVGLVLLVTDTPLRAVDPRAAWRARDISVEAVHFVGPDERWLVANNLALPNAIPCGPDQSLVLEPGSVATLTAEAVGSFGLGTCLDALEVEPLILAGCQAWEDARLVLAAQTLHALGQSLRLERIESTTNWELAFGSRRATVHRVVSLEWFSDGAGPACATPVDRATAAVVRVSGEFLGTDETFQPDVTVIDRGTTATSTASTARPGTLAWERDWLELEATFLEGTLRLPMVDSALAEFVQLAPGARNAGYRRQLFGVRALLHCNAQGIGVAALARLIDRDSTLVLPRPVACLHDFLLQPARHWPTYDRALLATLIDSPAAVVNYTLVANPTANFVAWAARGAPLDYGELLVGLARDREAQAASDTDTAGLATEYALDNYARLLTATSRELATARGSLVRAVLLAGPVERNALRMVEQCVRTFGAPDALARLFDLTTARLYTAGIPCVDARPNPDARIEAYRLLAYGLRSGTFGALVDAAGRDGDLLAALLGAVAGAIAEVTAAEARYPAGTTIAAWRASLPALDRMVVIRSHLTALLEARGSRVSVRDAAAVLRGLTECGVGLALGTVWGERGEGLVILALGLGAVVAGPTAAAVGGLLFLGSGLLTTGMAANDLALAWDQLDLAARTAGVCGAAVGVIGIAASVGPSMVAAARWTPAELRYRPVTVIDVRRLITRGRGGGMPIDERLGSLGARGGSAPATVEATPVAPLPRTLEAVVDALPEGRREVARAVVNELGGTTLTDAEVAAVGAMLESLAEPDGATAVARRRRQELDRLAAAGADPATSPEAAAWSVAGAAVLDVLLPDTPRSVAATPAAAAPSAGTPSGPTTSVRLAGTDAPMVHAAGGGIVAIPDLPPDVIASRRLGILQAFLGSDRIVRLLNEPRGRAAFTPEEVAALVRAAEAADPSADTSFLRALGEPRVIDGLREAAAEAARLQGAGAARVRAVSAAHLGSGESKSAFVVTLELEGGGEVAFVVAKGAIAADEAALLAQLGQKGLTQRLLTGLIDGIDGTDALLVSELITPARKVSPGIAGFIELFEGTADADFAAAIGDFDARLILETAEAGPGGPVVMANGDLHLQNLVVFRAPNGTLRAVAIDFAPKFTHRIEPDVAWAWRILQRSPDYANFPFAVKNNEAWLGAVLERMESSGMARGVALDTLERAARNLRDPAFLDAMRGFEAFPEPSMANPAADLVDAFVARMRQTNVVPLPPARAATAITGPALACAA